MTNNVLGDLLRALDIAVIERLPAARYEMVGPSPDWLEAAFDAAPQGARHTLAGALPFLDQFLEQAAGAWDARGQARAESGPFVTTVDGIEALLRATALTVDGRALLVIERLSGDADTRPMLQKAREQMLALEQLKRDAAGVQAPAAALAKAIADLGAADLPASTQPIVQSLRAAAAQLGAAAEKLPKPPAKGRR
jgi:hypothetical protein